MEGQETIETQATPEAEGEGFVPTPIAELFGGISPSSSVKIEEQADKVEKPKEDDDKVEQAKQEEMKTEPPPIDWEKKAKEFESEGKSYKKRYEDTHKWGNDAHRKLKEFGLDESNTGSELAPEVSPEVTAMNEAFAEREKASYAAAIEIHGKEKVDEMLFGENSPFREIVKDPSVHFAIRTADAPVLEAIKAVKAHAFFEKYGRDPEKVHLAIRKELESEVTEKLTKEFQRKLEKKDKLPNTLSGIKGGDNKNDGVFTPTPLKEIFG